MKGGGKRKRENKLDNPGKERKKTSKMRVLARKKEKLKEKFLKKELKESENLLNDINGKSLEDRKSTRLNSSH